MSAGAVLLLRSTSRHCATPGPPCVSCFSKGALPSNWQKSSRGMRASQQLSASGSGSLNPTLEMRAVPAWLTEACRHLPTTALHWLHGGDMLHQKNKTHRVAVG